jgi:hypothetical protein
MKPPFSYILELRIVLIVFVLLWFNTTPTVAQVLPQKKRDLRELASEQFIQIDSLKKLVGQYQDSLYQLNQRYNIQLKQTINLQNDQLRLLRDSTQQHQQIIALQNKILSKQDSLAILEQALSSMNSTPASVVSIDTTTLFSTLKFIEYGIDIQEEQLSITDYCPIGFSSDGRYFAYFSSYGDGAEFYTFEIVDIQNTGVPKTLVKLNFEEGSVSSRPEFFRPDTKEADLMIRSLLETYGITITNDFNTLSNSELKQWYSIDVDLKPIFKGTCYHAETEQTEKKIATALLKIKKNNKFLCENKIVYDKGCTIKSNILGCLQVPNMQKLICLISDFDIFMWEGWREVRVNMFVISIK